MEEKENMKRKECNRWAGNCKVYSTCEECDKSIKESSRTMKEFLTGNPQKSTNIVREAYDKSMRERPPLEREDAVALRAVEAYESGDIRAAHELADYACLSSACGYMTDRCNQKWQELRKIVRKEFEQKSST